MTKRLNTRLAKLEQQAACHWRFLARQVEAGARPLESLSDAELNALIAGWNSEDPEGAAYLASLSDSELAAIAGVDP